MKHNLCVKISYKKYLLANTSFPQPVVLQYTSGGRKSLEPEVGIETDISNRGYASILRRRKSLEPEVGIETSI
ncbi:MAG TPA: hypothetical protein VN954_02620, partial [Ktedonobacteraceae bacterium]|nr:hypothetical protein [Ktedonobacteraceae bacterium]